MSSVIVPLKTGVGPTWGKNELYIGIIVPFPFWCISKNTPSRVTYIEDVALSGKFLV